MSKRIYLDYAAAVPVHPEVKKEMERVEHIWGNASSLHQEGREARAAVDEARSKIANFLGAETDEMVFTSGATESNIMALRGVVEAKLVKGERPHILVNKLEHASIVEPVNQLEKLGARVTWLSVDSEGRANQEEMLAAITEDTVFVSIIYANNETGLVNDIAGLAKAAKQKNKNVVFHTDAAQAGGWLDVNVKELEVDLMSLSSYKLSGPKGLGLLYIKSGLNFLPIFPGTQEWGKRAGTEPVQMIAGLAKAFELSRQWPKEEIRRLRDLLISEISNSIEGVHVNTVPEHSVPHIANFSLAYIDSQLLTIALDREGLAASPGSACSSGAVEFSHVVKAMGVDLEKYPGSLRLSLGLETTESEVREAVEIVRKTVTELRNRG